MRPAVSLDGNPTDQRKAFVEAYTARDKAFLNQDLIDGVSTQDTQIYAAGGRSIPIRIYTSATNPPSSEKPAPAAVFFHGGGWVIGSIASDDIFCRMIAHDLGHVIVSVEYRLAPEDPYPAAVDDCYDAVLWTVGYAKNLNIDKSQIYVTGNSAGGQLAAAVALKIVASDQPLALAAQVLRIPATCHPQVYPQKFPERKGVPVFDDAAYEHMIGTWIRSGGDTGVSAYTRNRRLRTQQGGLGVTICFPTACFPRHD